MPGLTLSDGGPVHHPDRPAGFHPALRAAAHLLLAADRIRQPLRSSLRADILPLHPPTPRHLHAVHLLLDPDGSPDLATPHLRDDTHPTHTFLTALRNWAAARHLASPYVLELLLLTVSTWHTADRHRRARAALDRHHRTTTAVDPRNARSELPTPRPTTRTPDTTSATPTPNTGSTAPNDARTPTRTTTTTPEPATDWGPWVHLLTRPTDRADVSPVLELGTHLGHLLTGRRLTPPLTLRPTGWNPELETWDEAEARLRADFDARLQAHRRATTHLQRRQPHQPSPTRHAPHHLEWLALRQLRGWRPSHTARRRGVAVSTVHAALSSLSNLLELPLRPVKPGPTPL